MIWTRCSIGLRSIDFDQQSYEGRARIYLPQFYKENLPYVQFAQQAISMETAEQYRNEERALLAKTATLGQGTAGTAHWIMRSDTHFFGGDSRGIGQRIWPCITRTRRFSKCASMGELLERHMEVMLGLT